MPKSMEGKVVLVTGAGRGIGAAIAADLAHQGALLAVADINPDTAVTVAEAIVSNNGTAVGLQVDVSNRDSIQECIRKTVQQHGRLDVMFNNAGISQTCPFLDVTDEDFDRIMRVNGRGVLIGTQEAARQMIAQGDGGKIINTASIAGKQGYPLFAHYCASKFAVVAITQAAARALAEHRITVNCFAPGVVATELWQQLDREFIAHGITERAGQAMHDFSKDILLGCTSGPDDIVGVTRFLASNASNYITGQTIMVDGGMVLI